MAQQANAGLAALKALSARIGADPLLIQGAGGNSSLKSAGVLWVKASGTWLADAERLPIFVPVDLDEARRSFSRGAENVPALALPGAPAGLRPSIETSLHAFLPQRYVLHVHSVNAIAWCVQRDPQAALTPRLDGLAWAWLPYCRPGLPLARSVAGLAREGSAPDVLLLANHGLVVAAGDAPSIDVLLRDVELRLALPERPARPGPLENLADLAAADSPYRLADTITVHALGRDERRCAIVAGGSLYPDHVIFLGPAVSVLRAGETPAGFARVPADTGRTPPALLLVPGEGTLLRRDLSPEAVALVDCLAQVVARLPDDAEVAYLPDGEEEALLDWDAEKYRQALKRTPG
jgi:rhamnose utilization protein RhaD (predicted bifunctional aldolase and dehydrogenase)